MLKSNTDSCDPLRQIKEVNLPYDEIESQIKFLQGKVLTIIDASLLGEQKKAVKDLINQQFSEQLNWIYELTHTRVQVLGERQLNDVDLDETLKR